MVNKLSDTLLSKQLQLFMERNMKTVGKIFANIFHKIQFSSEKSKNVKI